MKRMLCLLLCVITAISLGACKPTDSLVDLSNANYTVITEKFSDVKITSDYTAIDAVNPVCSELGLSIAAKELKVLSSTKAGDSTYYRMQQYYEDIPVYGRTVSLCADSNHEASLLTANTIEIPDYFSTDDVISEQEALESLDKHYDEVTYAHVEEKVIYNLYGTEAQLAYRIIVNGEYKGDNVQEECIVSAIDGKLLLTNSLVQTNTEASDTTSEEDYNYRTSDGNYVLYDKKRNLLVLNSNESTVLLATYTDKSNLTPVIYPESIKDTINSGNHSITNNPAPEVLSIDAYSPISYETSSNGQWNSEALELMRSLESTYDFYLNILSRKGHDNNNFLLPACYNDSIIGNDEEGNNASSYNKEGYPQTAITIGYRKDTSHVDLVAHEFTHSVENKISCMAYKGESGALMEAYSDIFGELAEDYANDGELNNNCSWEHNGDRRLDDPEKSKNPSIYKGKRWGDTTKNKDNGYVHNNSTVISHTAYLMSEGIDGTNSKKIDNETLAHLWYRSMFLLHTDATFAQCADAVTTIASQMRLSGELTSDQCICVREAFIKAGISAELFGHRVVSNKAKLNVMSGKPYKNYDNYHLVIINEKNGKEVVNKDITSPDPYILDLDNGNYEILVLDNASTENSSDNPILSYITVTDSKDAYPHVYDKVYIYTDFGQKTNYKWVIGPTIEADNIRITGRQGASEESDLAIIEKNGRYGFIDYNGNMLLDCTFDCYGIADGCGLLSVWNKSEYDGFNVITVNNNDQSVYTPHAHGCSMSPGYNYENNTLVPIGYNSQDPSGRVVGALDQNTGKYAVFYDNTALTDFEYDNVYNHLFGDYLGVCKDGKWGYFNSSGEQIIPCEFLAVSSGPYVLSGYDNDDSVYSFSGNLVALHNEDGYGYYNSDGECLIPCGEFEDARPVQDGKAWVKQNGLWGIIQIDSFENVYNTTYRHNDPSLNEATPY